MRRLLVLMAVGVLVTLSACGDDSSSSPESEGSESASQGAGGGGGSTERGCALVSQDEVAAAAGTEVFESVELPTGCQWQVSPDDSFISYEWQAIPLEGFESNREVAADSSGMEVDPISGLGDDAFLRALVTTEGDVTNGETWVSVGGEAFFVRSTVAWGDDVAGAQREIAELLVARVG